LLGLFRAHILLASPVVKPRAVIELGLSAVMLKPKCAVCYTTLRTASVNIDEDSLLTGSLALFICQ
jgi:hypothetical protein